MNKKKITQTPKPKKSTSEKQSMLHLNMCLYSKIMKGNAILKCVILIWPECIKFKYKLLVIIFFRHSHFVSMSHVVWNEQLINRIFFLFAYALLSQRHRLESHLTHYAIRVFACVCLSFFFRQIGKWIVSIRCPGADKLVSQ